MRDQKLSDDERLLFLHSSLYERDSEKNRQRSVLEERVRSILGSSNDAVLTARYAGVASALRLARIRLSTNDQVSLSRGRNPLDSPCGF